MDHRRLFYVFCTLLIIFWSTPSFSQEEEQTYSISLTKTAEMKEEVQVVEGKKVLTETHVVQKGEHLWKVLREKGLLKKRDLSEILSMLKRLNGSLTNLDLIQPGEKIVIPLKIVPIAGYVVPRKEVVTPLRELKEKDLENYTVQPGDTLSRVVQGRYHLPAEYLYSEYLDLVKKLNPSVEDLNTIYPGQNIRLPIYSPQVVRRAIEPPPLPPVERTKEEEEGKKSKSIAHGLEAVFLSMGEEWVPTGRHFIPLKSGGQIDLNAESFPIINLRNGERVIVDLHRRLPQKMARLIEASWGTYRVAQLSGEDTLRTALQRVLSLCGYPKILENGQPLELDGEIPFRIAGDWVIVLTETPSKDRPVVAVINLDGEPGATPPPSLREYLGQRGIQFIDYPPLQAAPEGVEAPPLGGGDPVSAIEDILELTGQAFSTQADIPVYESRGADLKVVIRADFLLKVEGREAIIDLSGLDERLVPFLKEHDFLVLSLSGEKDPVSMVRKTLEFLGVQADAGPHAFTTGPGNDGGKIRFTLPGVVFPDKAGDNVLAISMDVPATITTFLFQKGYKILPLTS